MYFEHFGLSEPPFALTPNLRFRVPLPPYEEALHVLRLGIEGGEGLIKLVGEVGTGKTLLCRELLHSLGENFFTAYLPNPALDPRQLLHTLGEELGLGQGTTTEGPDATSRILRRLIELRRHDRRVIVLVDEAQAMPDETIEALRLLTNLETESAKLLQLVLFAQPELDLRLARPELRQIRQRISLPHRLRPLKAAETRRYVGERLHCAGCTRDDLFSAASLALLQRASRGFPRLVNVLAHKSLLAAYGEGSPEVRRRHVRRAIRDTDDAGSRLRRSVRRMFAARLGA
ncbi:MAG: ExeA family protein [Myxococcota bacterium]